MKISVTGRGTFKRCAQQYHYYRVEQLTPIVTNTAFLTGRLHDETLEQWTLDPTINTDDALMENAKRALLSAVTTYKEQTGFNFTTSELQPYWDSVEMARAMMRMYTDYWKSPLPEGYTSIEAQQTIIRPIPGCEHERCKDCYHGAILSVHNDVTGVCSECNGTGYVTHELEGKLDGVIRKDSNNALFVREIKTYGSRPTDDTLSNNDQFLAYLWLLGGIVPPTQIAGVAYDGMWKRDHVPKGRQLDDLFLRTILTRSQHEIDMFEKQLAIEARVMYNATPYTNRRWEGCYDCGYKKICDAHWKGDDEDYIRKTFYTIRQRNEPELVQVEV